jgi:RimJ/RimL family protein N-acetyltransferase
MIDSGPSGLVARRAETADSRTLFDWRNDPHTRASSVSQERIPWDEHSAWFDRVLDDDSKRWLYIVELDGVPLGMCRFDAGTETSDVEVSINLAPTHRGKGLARSVLATGIEEFAREGVGQRLSARIRRTNVASARVFASLGFALVGSDEEFDRYER